MACLSAGDATLTGEPLERLLHQAQAIAIKGESYWLKDKRKAGVIDSSSMETRV